MQEIDSIQEAVNELRLSAQEKIPPLRQEEVVPQAQDVAVEEAPVIGEPEPLEDSDNDLIVSSEFEPADHEIIPFVAPVQQNSIQRSLVRFGISYEELRIRPNYWTILDTMKNYNELKSKH